MTRAMTIVALTCFLVVGAAVTSILGRDSVPAARLEMASQLVRIPASNKESKKDRLAVAALALAAFEPPQQTASLSEPLRQAYASAGPDDIEGPKIAAPIAMAPAPLAPPKPKVANKPPPQKSYALLSDMQIASIKQRLRLSSDQEYYWPAVERALRAVARKIHATRKADPNAAGAPPIDPDAAEVQQLKSAAMPLLFQLREDQKEEVRTLARMIGLEKVAAQI
ncbi:MAG TPA: hypothetical protein VNN81_00065 [Bradyrhizobium sp.]|nr:hypothetical protein [Bradyrhizobium sp.]